jgi:putative membrane protein
MSDHKPVLIELDDAPAHDPATAPTIPDTVNDAPVRLRAARGSGWGRVVWGAVTALLGLVVSVAAWDFVSALTERVPALGYAAAGLLAVVALAALGLIWREVTGWRRLQQNEALRAQAASALHRADHKAALDLARSLQRLYAGRADLRWQGDKLPTQLADQQDADGVLALCESALLAPLDTQARAEIEAAARQTALLTALLPLPLIDVLAVLVTNLRMIRRIAEIYGGRAGFVGSLRLLRGVMAHLLATGAMAVGEDMLGSMASGSVVSKLSRRFGEGVVNAALTVRLGIAATEICRPLPYRILPKPRTSAMMGRAVSGLFDKGTDKA